MALLSSLPVHIALDNLTVVKKAQHYHTLLFSSDVPHISFSQINNGDLWQLFVHIVRARGPHSCAFSWTKGHALAPENKKYIDNSPSLLYQAVHNDKADTSASSAHHELFNPNGVQGSSGSKVIYHLYCITS
eukprot:10461494-Karenia_brevis.AAC.1